MAAKKPAAPKRPPFTFGKGKIRDKAGDKGKGKDPDRAADRGKGKDPDKGADKRRVRMAEGGAAPIGSQFAQRFPQAAAGIARAQAAMPNVARPGTGPGALPMRTPVMRAPVQPPMGGYGAGMALPGRAGYGNTGIVPPSMSGSPAAGMYAEGGAARRAKRGAKKK